MVPQQRVLRSTLNKVEHTTLLKVVPSSVPAAPVDDPSFGDEVSDDVHDALLPCTHRVAKSLQRHGLARHRNSRELACAERHCGVLIESLVHRGLPEAQIAREVRVSEGTVRYQLMRPAVAARWTANRAAAADVVWLRPATSVPHDGLAGRLSPEGYGTGCATPGSAAEE